MCQLCSQLASGRLKRHCGWKRIAYVGGDGSPQDTGVTEIQIQRRNRIWSQFWLWEEGIALQPVPRVWRVEFVQEQATHGSPVLHPYVPKSVWEKR